MVAPRERDLNELLQINDFVRKVTDELRLITDPSRRMTVVLKKSSEQEIVQLCDSLAQEVRGVVQTPDEESIRETVKKCWRAKTNILRVCDEIRAECILWDRVLKAACTGHPPGVTSSICEPCHLESMTRVSLCSFHDGLTSFLRAVSGSEHLKLIGEHSYTNPITLSGEIRGMLKTAADEDTNLFAGARKIFLDVETMHSRVSASIMLIERAINRIYDA